MPDQVNPGLIQYEKSDLLKSQLTPNAELLGGKDFMHPF